MTRNGKLHAERYNGSQEHHWFRHGLCETRAYKTEHTKRSRRKALAAHYARQVVYLAKRRGQLVPKPCVDCGAVKVQAHHEDYQKPLEVIWLCQRCHNKRHVPLRAAGITAVQMGGAR